MSYITYIFYIIYIIGTQKYLQSEWSRGVQYITYFTLNIALYKLPKIVAAKQVEDIGTKKIFLK